MKKKQVDTEEDVIEPDDGWLEESEVGESVTKVIEYSAIVNGRACVKRVRMTFNIIPGTMADTIDDASYDSEGELHMNLGQRELVRLSLGWSAAKLDKLIRHKGLSLYRQLTLECQRLNGHGTPEEVDAAKNEEPEVGEPQG